MEDLDDLMGFGDSKQNQKDKNSQEGKMRDTLGFLKISEQEKKKKEEQKLNSKQNQDEKYKKLSEVISNLNGYKSDWSLDYNLS